MVKQTSRSKLNNTFGIVAKCRENVHLFISFNNTFHFVDWFSNLPNNGQKSFKDASQYQGFNTEERYNTCDNIYSWLTNYQSLMLFNFFIWIISDIYMAFILTKMDMLCPDVCLRRLLLRGPCCRDQCACNTALNSSRNLWCP